MEKLDHPFSGEGAHLVRPRGQEIDTFCKSALKQTFEKLTYLNRGNFIKAEDVKKAYGLDRQE